VKLGEHDLDAAKTSFWFDVNGNTARLVSDFNRAIGVQLNVYRTSVSG
jgi:hypothetical protein